MTKPIGRDTSCRCRRFFAETIELRVRWYIVNAGRKVSPPAEEVSVKLTAMGLRYHSDQRHKLSISGRQLYG